MMISHAGRLLLLATTLLSGAPGLLRSESARVQVTFSEESGPLQIDRMGLGQGGLSDQPMWADRVPEVRALHPRLIRLFIQEYFELLPTSGRFHFETLDRSVDTILATGASPLMCVCFKPRALFPRVDQDLVEPDDYHAWEDLVYALVKHYRDRTPGITYWEIANEPDIGEDGGCPYRFKPESYVRYYQHTAAAILRAGPKAQVGGPALASSHSAILPALLGFCETNQVPLHFVSWHIYSNDPKAIGGTVDYVNSLLKSYPGIKPETILDEWNMDLMRPPLDKRFQSAFVCETIWRMKEAGLDYSCYYHIRDWYVNPQQFEPFMSRHGAAFMARWWNRMPQFDGLFDYQNQVRPAYFAFKLLSRLGGIRVRASSDQNFIHVFATHDHQLNLENVLVWNFSNSSATLELSCAGFRKEMTGRHLVLDAATADPDENSRLRPQGLFKVAASDWRQEVTLEPYAIHYWSFE
jgi:xylan 1,4-beta-xylosidase